jgi:hypothetical protein
MKADTIEVMGLFETDVRYLVPIYQRNYRWDEAEQWAPLWSDLRNVAEDILENGEEGNISDHFLGAIVCDQMPVFGRDAKAVSVIDGQQRLTTLALILAALLNVCEGRGFTEDGEYLAATVRNKETVVKGRLEHRYKVWPNPADREAFVKAMEGGGGDSRPERAIEYFRKVMEAWLDQGSELDPGDGADESAQDRMTVLTTAVLRFVKIVKIDLEENDNAQVIFESLNGRGERLTDADLIRNALFRQADSDGSDSLELYEAYWKSFDDERWSEEIAHGRHQRDRLSLFLNYWLSMKRLEEVQASALFREFKEYLRQSHQPVESVAKEIAICGKVFDSFDSHAPLSREWWFFRRLNEMDLVTVYPVLLFLYGLSEDVLSNSARIRALDAIESYLVRRLITRSSTRSYGSIFTEVLQVAGNGDPSTIDRRIIELLGEKTADTDVWPSDDAVSSAVLNTNIYKLRQSRLKMILEAIDVHRSLNGNVETVSLGHALWIEHLLPQGWREESAWDLKFGVEDRTAAAQIRDHKLHTLGNLTLTTSRLDISLSNRPWTEKLEMLSLSSALQLNRDLINQARADWDEDAIDERGRELTAEIIGIWPSAKALLG